MKSPSKAQAPKDHTSLAMLHTFPHHLALELVPALTTVSAPCAQRSRTHTLSHSQHQPLSRCFVLPVRFELTPPALKTQCLRPLDQRSLIAHFLYRLRARFLQVTNLYPGYGISAYAAFLDIPKMPTVWVTGFEPATSASQMRRSDQAELYPEASN